MRILYLTHTVTWRGGGIFYTAFHQARHLVRRGHDVTLLSISPSAKFAFSEQRVEGVKIVQTPDLLPGLARTGWDAWDTVRRILMLHGKTFDVVHCFESRPAVAVPGLFARCEMGAPLVFTWADLFGKGGRSEERSLPIRTIMRPVEDFCEKYFYPKGDLMVAMGQPLLERALAMGISADKAFSLLHGSDPERTRAIPRHLARRQLGTLLPDEGLLIGYLGYLWPVNANLLFATLKAVKERVDHRAKLLLIGNHRVNLPALLPADLQEDVIATGWVDYEKVNLYLCASDILMLPLKRTQVSEIIWPSKLNDYLAAGRPVVATDMSILRPLNRQAAFASLCADDPDSLAEGIGAITNDASLADTYGKNGRCLAENDLSWSTIVGQLETRYAELPKGNGRRAHLI